ncbi:hypothetical protein QR680_017583 [Steinernema hermaphroditum]|uniref:Uncharacterized protein n=1 Tax=Steinernema hermaphroditum TaxID=289476 RepID=A0AA39LPA5_9BILA|nr:hypothetical protein QR680_017583 [Steinernema hermaphroditum]
MTPNRLLHFAVLSIGFFVLGTFAEVDDSEPSGFALDPSALARYRMYAYGNLLKRSTQGPLGTAGKLSLFTNKRRAEGRGAALHPGSIRSFSGTPKFQSKNCFFSVVQCSPFFAI